MRRTRSEVRARLTADITSPKKVHNRRSAEQPKSPAFIHAALLLTAALLFSAAFIVGMPQTNIAPNADAQDVQDTHSAPDMSAQSFPGLV